MLCSYLWLEIRFFFSCYFFAKGFFAISSASFPNDWIKGALVFFPINLCLSLSFSTLTNSSCAIRSLVNVNKFMVENHFEAFDISIHSLYLLKINQIKLQRDSIFAMLHPFRSSAHYNAARWRWGFMLPVFVIVPVWRVASQNRSSYDRIFFQRSLCYVTNFFL